MEELFLKWAPESSESNLVMHCPTILESSGGYKLIALDALWLPCLSIDDME